MTMKAEPKKTESELAAEMVIRVTLPTGAPYAFTVHDVEWIDWEDLHGEIQGQAQRYAFYAMLHVGVKDDLRKASAVLARFVVDMSEAVREELSVELGGKAPTETRVRQAIAARDGYRKLEDRVEVLTSLEARVGVIREGLGHRRDMLTSAAMFRAPESSPSASARAMYRMKRS